MARPVDGDHVWYRMEGPGLPDGIRQVRELAPVQLLLRVGGAHDLRVVPDAARDRERTLLAVDRDAANVDLSSSPGQQRPDRVVEVLGDLERAGEQVPGARRDDAELRVRPLQLGGRLEHRPVATDDDDDIDVMRGGPTRQLAQLALAHDDPVLDLPAFRAKGPRDLVDGLGDRAALPPSADDERA